MLTQRNLPTVALLAALAMATPTFASNGHDAHHAGAADSGSEVVSALSDGTIKKIDKSTGKITISHGPLENLAMPAMTMVFRAADASMLEQVRIGDKVRFRAERVDGVFTVTKLEAAN